MTWCAVGRSVTHPDPTRWPGFQDPCPQLAKGVLVMICGNGELGELPLCHPHGWQLEQTSIASGVFRPDWRRSDGD